MKFNNLKISIILLFLFSLFMLLLNNNIINNPFCIESKIFYKFLIFNVLIYILIYYLIYKIYCFYIFYLYMFFIFWFFILILILIFYILKKLNLIKVIVLVCLLISISHNLIFLSSETDFPGSGGGNGLNGAITLIIILLGGAIGMVYQLHKISKIPPKFSTFKPKTEGIEPIPSKFFNAKDESVPEILKLADKISRGEFNPPKLPKVPEIPIRTPFERALDDFCVHLAIFTAFLFILYAFYSKDVLGFREYILHVKSKINKNTFFWRNRFYIILTFQFIVTILILFL